jgi:pentalenene oxygenase
MAAATHTTSILLTWACHLLSTRPQLQEDAHDEVIAACGPGGVGPSSIDRLRGLVHCRRILMEALRLYPPLWIVHRTPAREYEAAGHRFASRRLISIPIYVLHRDARHYEEPDEFRPERWAGRPPRGAFLPFGTGGRGCMGENLAMTQAMIVLAVVLGRFRLRPTMSAVQPVACGYLLKPAPTVRIQFERRM